MIKIRESFQVYILLFLLSCGVPGHIPEPEHSSCPVGDCKEHDFTFEVDDEDNIVVGNGRNVPRGPGDSENDLTPNGSKEDPYSDVDPSDRPFGPGDRDFREGTPVIDETDSEGGVGRAIGEALESGFKSLGKAAKTIYGALSGQSRRKQSDAENRIREIRQKAMEAQSLANRIGIYQNEIVELGKNIRRNEEAASSDKFISGDEIQAIINRMGQRHNATVSDIESYIFDLPSQMGSNRPDEKEEDLPCQLKLKSCTDLTEEDRKVIIARDFIDYGRHKIEKYSGTQRKGAEALLDTAETLADEAEFSYNAGNMSEGDWLADVAITVADVAISFVPGVGWGHDLYQFVTGGNLVTGHELSNTERVIAGLGVISGGVLSSVAAVGSLSKFANKVSKNKKVVKDPVDLAHAANQAERTVDSARKYGVSGDRLGKLMGDMRQWTKTKGNFDIPKGTTNEANILGESWVGVSAKKIPYKNHPGKYVYESADGTKLFREPVIKRDGRKLANFEWKEPATGKWIGNGHMTITD